MESIIMIFKRILLITLLISAQVAHTQERTAGGAANSDADLTITNNASKQTLLNSIGALGNKIENILSCQKNGQFFNSTTGACVAFNESDPLFTDYKASIPICDFDNNGEINRWDGDKWICETVPEPVIPDTYCYSGPGGKKPSAVLSKQGYPKRSITTYRDHEGQGGGCVVDFIQTGNCHYRNPYGHYYNECRDSRGCFMKSGQSAEWTKRPNGTRLMYGVGIPDCKIRYN